MNKSGFTLIELVIVIIIIVVLTVTAIIPILATRRGRLDGAANRLMFDLRYAQQLALAQQVYCGVVFNPGNNNYFVYIGNTATKATDPVSREDLDVDFDTESAYRGVVISSTNFGDRIFFDYEGNPFDNNNNALSSTGTVTLQYGSYSDTIDIEPGTGEVKI